MPAFRLTTCPACGSTHLEPFYSVQNIPVHSCLMLDNEKDAADFPRGDVELACCQSCGFITNLVFDPQWSTYAPNYEDQQSFSPTFNSFAGRLVKDLVERYKLYDKTILEIGCSKGDFLALMCEAGNNRGIGIDPSAVSGRVKSSAADRMTFYNDYYGEKHVGIAADFICSRHTLEHIQPVSEFVNLLSLAVRHNNDVPVMIEIPDTVRVLKECAFEDIYYEHCSYFTPGTLARLMRSAGFAVTDIRLEYEDQYLVIECSTENKTFSIEESREQTYDMVQRFCDNIKQKQNHWLNFVNEAKKNGESIAIWGSGSKCVAFMSTLGIQMEIDSIVDINPNRHGKYIPGIARLINAPDTLSELKPDHVIVMNRIYEKEISNFLNKVNVKTNIVSL